jgi:Fe-S-cluster containining protein
LKFPAIALETYQRLKSNPLYLGITEYIVRSMRSFKTPKKRAEFVHQLIDEYNDEIYTNPIIAKLSPCQKGCAGCCHTEVSCTPDEADVLAKRVIDGVNIDWSRLHMQKTMKEENRDYLTLPYELRACVFLGEDNQCRVYEDRPSVCRTNMVIGESSQCCTKDGTTKEMRLVKTEKADMAIIGFFMMHPHDNSTLSDLLWTRLSLKVPHKKLISNKEKFHKIFESKTNLPRE